MYAIRRRRRCGYVQLDLDHPTERRDYVLDTAGCALVLTTSRAHVTAERDLAIDDLDLTPYSPAR